MRLLIKRSATAMSGTPETIRSIRIEKRFLSLKEKKKGGSTERHDCICKSCTGGEKDSFHFPGRAVEVSPKLTEEIEGRPSMCFNILHNQL